MKAKDVKVGGVYLATVSGKTARVRIDAERVKQCGSASRPSCRSWWEGTNLDTGRRVSVRSAQRLWTAEGAPVRDDVPSGWAKYLAGIEDGAAFAREVGGDEARYRGQYEQFTRWIKRLGASSGQGAEQVYDWWQGYVADCTAYDQSPTEPEFEDWYARKLHPPRPAVTDGDFSGSFDGFRVVSDADPGL